MRARSCLATLIVGLLLSATASAAAKPQAWDPGHIGERRGDDSASALREGQTFRDCADVCPEMIVIPAGSFFMGLPDSEPSRDGDEGPQHRVGVARFAAAVHEVTRSEWAAFVRDAGRAAGGNCYTDRDGDGSWSEDPSATWRDPGFAQTGSHPVVCVNWDDAQAYAGCLSKRTGQRYRLLTEAEWEYAACAGSTSAYFWGDEANAGCAFMNGADAAAKTRFASPTASVCNDGAAFTAEVGHYRPNPFGLYDMIGNVWEWTQDCYVTSYLGAPADGSSVETANCSLRVLRGGSWSDVPNGLRSANRNGLNSAVRYNDRGFRLARTI